MSFRFFKKHTKADEVVLVLDIGSASVGGALVLFSKNKVPSVLYTTRLPITIPEKIEEHDFTRSMIGFVKKTLEQVTVEGVKHLNFKQLRKKDISKVVCVYASPWFASETKCIHLTEKEPLELSEKFINELVKKEQREFAEKSGITDDISVVDKNIISTKLNGYVTSDPYGKKATDIELALFLGIVPKNIIKLIEKEVQSKIHPDDITHHSFSLIAYRTITDLFPADSNSIIFDVTGEVTDIAVVENDVIIQTSSVPFGRNTLVRKIAMEKGVTNDIALSLLHLYAHERAETKLYTEIDAIIADARESWKKKIKDIVPNTEDKTIFITADEDVSPVFKKYIMTSDPKKVIVLHEDHFEGVVHTNKNILEDAFISTTAVFLNNVFQSTK